MSRHPCHRPQPVARLPFARRRTLPAPAIDRKTRSFLRRHPGIAFAFGDPFPGQARSDDATRGGLAVHLDCLAAGARNRSDSTRVFGLPFGLPDTPGGNVPVLATCYHLYIRLARYVEHNSIPLTLCQPGERNNLSFRQSNVRRNPLSASVCTLTTCAGNVIASLTVCHVCPSCSCPRTSRLCCRWSCRPYVTPLA